MAINYFEPGGGMTAPTIVDSPPAGPMFGPKKKNPLASSRPPGGPMWGTTPELPPDDPMARFAEGTRNYLGRLVGWDPQYGFAGAGLRMGRDIGAGMAGLGAVVPQPTPANIMSAGRYLFSDPSQQQAPQATPTPTPAQTGAVSHEEPPGLVGTESWSPSVMPPSTSGVPPVNYGTTPGSARTWSRPAPAGYEPPSMGAYDPRSYEPPQGAAVQTYAGKPAQPNFRGSDTAYWEKSQGMGGIGPGMVTDPMGKDFNSLMSYGVNQSMMDESLGRENWQRQQAADLANKQMVQMGQASMLPGGAGFNLERAKIFQDFFNTPYFSSLMMTNPAGATQMMQQYMNMLGVPQMGGGQPQGAQAGAAKPAAQPQGRGAFMTGLESAIPGFAAGASMMIPKALGMAGPLGKVASIAAPFIAGPAAEWGLSKVDTGLPEAQREHPIATGAGGLGGFWAGGKWAGGLGGKPPTTPPAGKPPVAPGVNEVGGTYVPKTSGGMGEGGEKINYSPWETGESTSYAPLEPPPAAPPTGTGAIGAAAVKPTTVPKSRSGKKQVATSQPGSEAQAKSLAKAAAASTAKPKTAKKSSKKEGGVNPMASEKVPPASARLDLISSFGAPPESVAKMTDDEVVAKWLELKGLQGNMMDKLMQDLVGSAPTPK